MNVELNPADARESYLAHLNTSFHGWGDADRYRWAFEREAGGPRADLMVLRDGDAVLAGSAVSYRAAILPGGVRARVGIMTGSWTLPPARGRGCFTRIIEESRALCRARDAALLLAFVTEDNASYRRLRDAGSTLVETAYWVVPPPEGAPAGAAIAAAPRRAHEARVAHALHQAHEARRPPGLAFTYDLAAYTGQLLERPDPTEVLETEAGLAIVERAPTTDRVLAAYPRPGQGAVLISSLVAAAHARGRTLFTFTCDAERASWLAPSGVSPRRGFMTLLAADGDDHPTLAALSLENGDRM